MRKPIVVECFADNGAHSHWEMIDPDTGEKLAVEKDGPDDPTPDPLALLKRCKEALNKLDSWLVCASITTPEDMAQSFETMQKMTSALLSDIDKMEEGK